MITVVLADDQRLVRAGLTLLISQTDDIEIVGEAVDGVEAVRLCAQHTPDVVLMDLRMPGLDGVEATKQITRTGTTTKVLVITTFDDDEHLYAALAAGAAGFLVKDTEPANLLDAIRRTHYGDTSISPAIVRRIVARAILIDNSQNAFRDDLTDRELAVLQLVGEGLSNEEIAEHLYVSKTTVKTHIANLMAKTQCNNRVRLAVYGYRRSLWKPPES
ncbi:response regulator [Mycobacteriaceae bacterium NPDC060252]